jgi:predicted nucleic acid-binding protein
MIVVADTGPIIALGKVGRIDLLEIFEAPVVIPPHVRRELLSKPTSETQEIERSLSRQIQVRDVPSLRETTKEVVNRLDPGEQEAVSLAAGSDEETLLIMDDQAGRRAARRLDCSVTGVIGVLLRAKEVDQIEAVGPLLEEMRSAGYWLSDEIIEHARTMADETTSPNNADGDNL